MQKARRAMFLQRTIKAEISLDGVGLHSGQQIQLKLRPGKPNQGVLFLRTDLADSVPIPANYQNIVNTQLATTLGMGKVTVGTIEHLMAALHGCNIDNVIVELNGPEVPIMDGSAKVFCEALASVGS